MPVSPTSRVRPSLGQLARESLWLGVIGFGGGLTVLASIRRLAVEKRRWLTEREFANAAAVAQMLPGGAAANALAYLGLRFAGVRGALTAYAAFILPGFAAVLALAWGYAALGTTPSLETAFGGFNAAIVGIIASITVKMVRSSVGRLWQMGVAAGALLLSLAGGAPPGEVAVLGAVVGLVADLGTKRWRLAHLRRTEHGGSGDVALPDEGGTLERRVHPEGGETAPVAPPPPRPPETQAALWATALALVLAAGPATDLLRLGLLFFRTGLGAYGGGFAIVPHLQQTLHANGWLSDRQFADAVAIGKITPGPVLLLATFIGYLRHGFTGGVVATVSVFAAPFALVVLAGTWLDRMRSRRGVRAALRGLTPAVLGLMAAAALSLGEALDGQVEAAIAAASALTLVRFEINPVLLLVAGGAARVGLKLAGV